RVHPADAAADVGGRARDGRRVAAEVLRLIARGWRARLAQQLAEVDAGGVWVDWAGRWASGAAVSDGAAPQGARQRDGRAALEERRSRRVPRAGGCGGARVRGARDRAPRVPSRRLLR